MGKNIKILNATENYNKKESLRKTSIFFYVFGSLFIVFSLIFLLVEFFLFLLFGIVGLIFIFKGRQYSKMASYDRFADRQDNAVTTITNEKVEWKPTLYVNDFLEVDEINKKFAIFEEDHSKKYALVCILNYEDLLSYELLEDDTLITTNNLEQIQISKRCQSLKIKINIKNMASEPIYIKIINSIINCSSNEYKTRYEATHEILCTLEKIENEIGQNKIEISKSCPSDISISTADEIKKFKSLLNDGVISEEEFEAKKKQLLDI